MKDESIAVFIQAAQHYFDTVSDSKAEIGTPFLIKDINDYLFDYTGVIGITGNHKGSVFFTTLKYTAVSLLAGMGILSNNPEKLMDLVGEVSNTIAGNVRREFGQDFMLSTPVLMFGKAEQIKVSKIDDIYVVPIIWRHSRSYLIVSLDEE